MASVSCGLLIMYLVITGPSVIAAKLTDSKSQVFIFGTDSPKRTIRQFVCHGPGSTIVCLGLVFVGLAFLLKINLHFVKLKCLSFEMFYRQPLQLLCLTIALQFATISVFFLEVMQYLCYFVKPFSFAVYLYNLTI